MPLSRAQVRRGLRNLARPRNLTELPRLLRNAAYGRYPIYIDYPFRPACRYGWGRPPHPMLYEIIDGNRQAYLRLLEQFAGFRDGLARIPEQQVDASTPYWRNRYLGGLNAAALYCFPALLGSRTYLEVGSGNSTKFIRQSIADNGLPTRVVSIDPEPRAEIDRLCDRVIRQRLEDVDLGIFRELQASDILVIDNSHRCFQNSDVTVVFLEILPILSPGVLIYIDDIYLPYDYPPEWADRSYSEQYLLAVLLMADAGRRYEVVLPHVFIEHDEALAAAMHGFWRQVGRTGAAGNGMWLRVKPA